MALGALVVGAVATAINPVFVRLSDLEPVASAFHRMVWALPLLWGWAWLEGRPDSFAGRSSLFRNMGARDVGLLVLCGVFFAADLTALHFSIQLTAAANAILFLNAQPIYVVFGAWLLFGERVRPAFLAGVAVAIVGASVMLIQSAGFGEGQLLGDGLGIAAGIFYAGFILTASRLRSRFSSAVVNTWTCLIGAPLLLVAALTAGQEVIPASTGGWAVVIALGVISQAGGQGLIVWGLAHLATGFSAVVLLVAPVAAALFAWVFLSEPLAPLQLLGMGIVLAGIAMAHRARPAE